jgi:hypothetical protein
MFFWVFVLVGFEISLGIYGKDLLK